MSDLPLEEKKSIFSRLRWKAIVIGFVVDYGGSVTYGMVAGIVMGIIFAARGGNPAEMTATMLHSQPYMISGLAVGSLFVVIGGLIVGRLAPHARLLNAGALGVIDIALGLTYMNELPFWYHVAAMLVTLPCALLGGWLAGKIFPPAFPPPLP